MIRLGYVGVNTLLPSASKTFRLAGYTEERMLEVTRANLRALKGMLEWNLDHAIHLFRITSQLVPFGSHPVNSGAWCTALKDDFREAGAFALRHAMRLSMHPGQYTVINTPDEAVYDRGFKDLDYHCEVLSLMGLDHTHKIILHGGGAYQDRQASLNRLEQRIRRLPAGMGKRLALENDEKVFPAEAILGVCRRTGLPGVIDLFHHQILPSLEHLPVRDLVLEYGRTWQGGRQKIHYSEQAPGRSRGAHSDSVDIAAFERLYAAVRDLDLDIMIESKDKQASVLKLRAAFPDLR